MSGSPSTRATAGLSRGVHPPDRKSPTAEAPIEVLPTPAKVLIPLLQHTGAPAAAQVKPKQDVELGELLAEPDGFISAGVHASVRGKTARASVATLPNGRHVAAVPITSADEQPLAGTALYADVLGGDWAADTANIEGRDPQDIADAVRDAGIVGLGGAAFPSHVKLARNDSKPIDTLLVNGCECEPYLTADHRIMVEAAPAVVAGARLAARANGAERIVIAIEDNKPAAVEAVRAACGERSRAACGERSRASGAAPGVTVAVLRTRYPQGGEKQAVQVALGREVPNGGLPLDVGVVVLNVGTSAAIARAVLRGKPLTHRVVTVTGAGVAEPKNLLVPVGTPYRALLDACGQLTRDAVRVVAGGPMMGFALGDLDTPVTKGTSGVVALTACDLPRPAQTACIRCGRCVDVCPMNLVPTKIATAARNRDWDLARRYEMLACIECGCCAYACPARIPLAQLIRMGKAELPRE
ncbi:MAG: electron transport complex subunit RsxC [Phycisphaerae bacterium]|nr:electron transport complex subunit RsxC [Phycisphaerae bacterium]